LTKPDSSSLASVFPDLHLKHGVKSIMYFIVSEVLFLSF